MSSITTPSLVCLLATVRFRALFASYTKSLTRSSNGMLGGVYIEGSNREALGEGTPLDPPSHPGASIAASPIIPICSTLRRRTTAAYRQVGSRSTRSRLQLDQRPCEKKDHR